MDGIILVNKPKGYTSHDIVNIARKALHTKKVGHCGTLDPDATGVLVLCINKATKVLQFLNAETKEYIATLSLGVATDSYDASGTIVETRPFQPIEKTRIETVLTMFLGKQMQVPPIYSAIKVNGKKLYEYARNKEEVKIEPREIEIFEIELLNSKDNEIQFRVLCSKGTYIRSLCVDIAKKLNYPGHMKDLVRTRSGYFSLENCISLKDLKEGKIVLHAIEEALIQYPSYVVKDETIVYHGKQIKSDHKGLVVIKNTKGKVLAMYRSNENGYLKNVRGLW